MLRRKQVKTGMIFFGLVAASIAGHQLERHESSIKQSVLHRGSQTQAHYSKESPNPASDHPSELDFVSEEQEAKVLKVHEPQRQLIKHPQFGLVVRLSYDSGTIRYEAPGALDRVEDAVEASE